MEKNGVVPGEEEQPEGSPTTEEMLKREQRAVVQRAMDPKKKRVLGPAIMPGKSEKKGPRFTPDGR